MIAIALALVLGSALTPSPIPLKPCAASCMRTDWGAQCYFELRPVCLKREIECADSPTIDCVPVSVSLGAWSPIYTNASNESTPSNWSATGGPYSVTPLTAPLVGGGW